MAEMIADTCDFVPEGDTFSTVKDVWIRLARVYTPDEGEPGYSTAKQLLTSLILNKIVVYQQVETSYTRIVAEVWQGGENVNDIMVASGYGEN